jgi:arylformamidase
MAVDSVAERLALMHRFEAEARERSDQLRSEFRAEQNLAYGPHPRHRLDVYFPRATALAAPVFVFLHGGGFRTGEPGWFGYVARPFVERGALFVAMAYRLAPETRFPDSTEDVELGLSWLERKLPDWGGDMNRVYLGGHSAGAALSAYVGLRWPSDLVRGLVLVSGMYDFANRSPEMIDRASARYVPDLCEAIERLPEHSVVVSAEYDLPGIESSSAALHGAISTRGGSAESIFLPKTDHFYALNALADEGPIWAATQKMMEPRN